MKDEINWGLRQSDLPEGWPAGPDGEPERAELLISAQSELGGGADVLLSMLNGCGIPAFKSGTLGKVIFGFAGRGVDIYVPQSLLEDAKAILDNPAQPGGEE
ncbi:hypothetical protein [uncultured Oscillibacter sp.]|uniref:hypothetical protein n=1 Tax=uncultured Oscillibacter sp. TaxID=876091 RepID=UPI0025E1F6E7|nr:hypothetical protein [uncultured Oscillibacter sp.]